MKGNDAEHSKMAYHLRRCRRHRPRWRRRIRSRRISLIFEASRLRQRDPLFDQAVSANDDLKPLLVKFSKLALGEGNVSPDDKDEFDKLLNKAADKALNLKKQSSKPDGRPYRDLRYPLS